MPQERGSPLLFRPRPLELGRSAVRAATEPPAGAGHGVSEHEDAEAMSRYAGLSRYLRTVWDCRHFWLSLVKLDVRSRYRRSVLGLGWSLLHPIAMTAVLCLVFYALLRTDFWAHVPYVLTGMAVWGYLTGVMLEGCHSLLSGEKYIRCHPAPMAIYPLRTVLGTGFHFLLTLAVALAATWLARGFDPGNLPVLATLVPAGLLLFLFGWSTALLFAFANVYFPDTRHITQIAVQLLFYLTGVI
jgi:lipopolysaccharide transport system permease protein